MAKQNVAPIHGHEVLEKFFARKKAKHPGYRQSTLARHLKLSRAMLTQILKGRRRLPIDKVETFCKALDIDPEARDYILTGLLHERGVRTGITVRYKNRKTGRKKKKETWQLATEDQIRLLEDWCLIPILDCTLLKDYDGTESFIAKRLGLSEQTVRWAVSELKKLGTLKIENGRFKKAMDFFEFNSNRFLPQIRRYHSMSLVKAREVLNRFTSEQDREARLITTLTFTCANDRVSWAKQRILEVIHEISTESNLDTPDEVYQLSVQFFPLSRKRDCAKLISPKKIEP